ncbi:PREDICTED: disease resistance protein RPM1-like [Nelumbo nucifera]|uniref:Disease resistance protein RPM1-like n=1 Tax=Nelumbo nucifera TaxID=4432 RepID=A0A1U8Q8D6_NELNU|nr:PREDICTED: disease resistance protein RPM1-like [Nelumbo nucifera]
MELGAVAFLLDNLRLVVGEVELIRGIRGHVINLKDELKSIQEELSEAYTKQEGNRSLKTWIKQVGTLAYDIENVLDEYKLYATPHSHKLPRFLGNLISFHSMAKQIEDIRKELKEKRKRYTKIISSQSPAGSTTSIETRQFPKVASYLCDESQIVGFDKPERQLISLLKEPGLTTTVISVAGMGGLGKTTLVRKVYKLLKGTFECQAWVTVGQSYRKTEILRHLLSQFSPSSSWGNAEAEQHLILSTNSFELTAKVKDYLQQKRFLVVFDDIWGPDIWEYLRCLLPNDGCGSRIIVTTRRNDVANSCIGSCGHVYNLQPLSPKDAQELLCKRAFSSTFAECPSEQKVWAEKTVRRCERLPLAIDQIGKLVRSNKRKTMFDWGKLDDTLGFELASNEHLSCITKLLSLSFNNLSSYHYTYCLLYISIFPKGYAVSCRRLIRLWIAEGFIEQTSGRTFEEVAEDYLNYLIERNLVHVEETEISLHSLSISSQRMEERLHLQTMSNPPIHLQRLYLKGHLQSMPRWISELHNLVRIRLKWSKLKDNPIEALQDLPSLMELQLLDAYCGDKLDFMQKKFKKLKILEFEQLCQLRTVILYKGTLPNLQKLVIRCCPMLRAVPRGIDNLTQLKELELQDMDDTFIKGIRKNGGECRWMVNHIPKIRSYSHGCLTDLS